MSRKPSIGCGSKYGPGIPCASSGGVVAAAAQNAHELDEEDDEDEEPGDDNTWPSHTENFGG